MTPEAFDAAALALAGAAVDIRWGSDRCYTVGGKMFAVAGGDPAGEAEPRYSFKCSDGAFEQLIAHGLVAAKLTRKARAELGLA